MSPVGNDFCLVQLTAAGVAMAKGHTLRVSDGRTAFTFTAEAQLKVAKYEWNALLRDHSTVNGTIIFEIVSAQAPPAQAPTTEAPATPAEETH